MGAGEGNEVALDLDSWEQMLLANAADLIAAGRAEDHTPGPIAIVPVPHQCRPLTPTPAIARRLIGDYLRQAISRAFKTDPGPQPARHEAEQGPLMDAACRLCQGYCCKTGWGANAQLGVEDIQRYRRRHPNAAPEQVLDHYLDLIPDRMTLGGCFYQGPVGCTLPRDMRSETCNTFICRGQRVLGEAEAAGAQSYVMVASIQTWPVAAALWDAEAGYRDIGASEADET